MNSERNFAASEAMAQEKPELSLKGESLQKAREIIDKYSPKLENFVSEEGYDSEMVKGHIRESKELKERFEQNRNPENKIAREYSEIMEAIIYDQAEKNEWFGPELMTSLPSSYDDYINGTDIIIQKENEDGELEPFFTIDVTFSNSLKKKFVRITDEINNGELTEILYYEDTNGAETIRKPVENVPKIVIGVHPETLMEIATKWIHNSNKDLATHPIQTYLLEQTFAQLTSLSNYAFATKNFEIRDKFRYILKTLLPVLKEKRAKIGMGTLANDKVLDNILSAVRDVTKIEK